MAQATKTVGQYMTANPLSVQKSTTLDDAHRVMREHGIRHLPVVDGTTVVGVLSDRDIHFSRSLHTSDPTVQDVGDGMTANPVTYPSTTPLKDVARMMAQFRCGSMLVVDDGRLVGIFTTVDALRVLADFVEESEQRDEASTRLQASAA